MQHFEQNNLIFDLNPQIENIKHLQTGPYMFSLLNKHEQYAPFARKSNICIQKMQNDTLRHYEANPDLIRLVEPIYYENYTEENSLLFTGESGKFLSYSKDKIISIDQYVIVFAIGITVDGSYLAPTTLDAIDLNACHFYDEFFKINPRNISTIDCPDGGCYSTILLEKDGIWCTTCHGDLDQIGLLDKLIHESMKISDFPKESILQIIKISTLITDKNKESLFREIHSIQQEQIENACELFRKSHLE